jgi:hypothetical protein
VWLTEDVDYAAGFAQLYDQDFVWSLKINLDESEILDLSACGLDPTAVAAALQVRGFSIDALPVDERLYR